MSQQSRDYTTWEEDFLSDRCELHGYRDELVAIVDRSEGEQLYFVQNAAGTRIATGVTRLDDAKRIAESLLR